MKLTKTHRIKASKSGMTLLELTVVILVLLSLISILFIGARAWKRGADRAASVLIIRNVQQAVRANANMTGLAPLDAMDPDDIFGANKFIENNPTDAGGHPAGPDYAFVYGVAGGLVVPEVGTLYLNVEGSDPQAPIEDQPDDTNFYEPKPEDIGDW